MEKNFFVFPHKKGVTLIELLVVIVTSAIVLSTVMASFASLIKVTQKIDVSRQLQKEINFALTRIADKMRSYSVNYDAYTMGRACSDESIESTSKVCLGDFIFEKKEKDDIANLYMQEEPLFSKAFQVNDWIVFDITPTANPYETGNTRLQPKMTVFLDIASRQYPDINFQIQSTLSSRLYQ